MSPRNAEQNQQIRDERREQILQAALRVFAQKGLTGTKISDIANAAGLSHGLVYHYFKSKDEIFTELVKEARDSSLEVFKIAAETPGTPLEKLHHLTEMILSGAYEGEGPLYFYIMIQATISDAIPAEVKEIIFGQQKPSYVDYLMPMIIEGQQQGLFATKDDPARLLVLYMALVQGLAIVQMPNTGLPMPSAEMILRVFGC